MNWQYINNAKKFMHALENKLKEYLKTSEYNKIKTILNLYLRGGNRYNQIFLPFVNVLEKNTYNETQQHAIAFFLSRLVYLDILKINDFSLNENSIKKLEKIKKNDAINNDFNSNIKSLINLIIKNHIYEKNKEVLFYLILSFMKKFISGIAFTKDPPLLSKNYFNKLFYQPKNVVPDQ